MYCFNIIEDSRVFLFYPYSPFHFKCFLEQKIIFIATISMMRIVQIQCRSFGCVLDGEEPCWELPFWLHSFIIMVFELITQLTFLFYAIAQAFLLPPMALPLPLLPHLASCRIVTQMLPLLWSLFIPPGAITSSLLALWILLISLSFIQHPFECLEWYSSHIDS